MMKCIWLTVLHIVQMHCCLLVVQAVWKAVPGWIMLTRRHAAEIVALNSKRFASQLGDLVAAWGPPGQWTERSQGVFAPEEVFFPTMLALLGYLSDSPAITAAAAVASFDDATNESSNTDINTNSTVGSSSSSSSSGSSSADSRSSGHHQQLINRAKANADKIEVRLKSVTYAEFVRNGDANPRSFERLTPQLVDQFCRSGALFARKFKKGSVTLSEWRQLVCNQQNVRRCQEEHRNPREEGAMKENSSNGSKRRGHSRSRSRDRGTIER